ncbi:MAG: hypothetical protein R3307_07655, partial [Anaerolineales bacterium]|nr:hypothetical protein [Anaerolineales bacterium]
MRKLFVLILLFCSACGLPTSQQVTPPPAFPTAYIDPSYPTVQAESAAPVQSSSGIDVQVN